MNLRSLILILFIATCSSALAEPNVVIFLAADAGWGDCSHSGNRQVRTQTHHLDSAGQRFDMVADPGQTKPVNNTQPALAARLTAAAELWCSEMFGATMPNKAAGNPVDPRSIPVGYHDVVHANEFGEQSLSKFLLSFRQPDSQQP